MDATNPGTESGVDALIKAARDGDCDLIRLLLDQGMNVNARDQTGHTALIVAPEGGIEIVRLLLDKGADVNAQTNYGSTALEAAAFSGNIEIVTLLLDCGADVNSKQAGGKTVLMSAVQGASFRELDRNALLRRNSRPLDFIRRMRSRRETREGMLDEGGEEELVRLLLERGANVNARTEWGITALMFATRGKPAIVRMLLDNGADVRAKDAYGRAAIHWDYWFYKTYGGDGSASRYEIGGIRGIVRWLKMIRMLHKAGTKREGR